MPVTPTYSQEQQTNALADVAMALGSQGVPNVRAATPRQLELAIDSVVAGKRQNKAYVGALTYALVQARPDLTGDIVRFMLAAIRTERDPKDFEADAKDFTPDYKDFKDYPGRGSRGSTGPADSERDLTSTVVAAAMAANPSAFGTVLDSFPPPSATATSDSAMTLNPANINGPGSGLPVVRTNSPENASGG